jgi:hypothetical protein
MGLFDRLVLRVWQLLGKDGADIEDVFVRFYFTFATAFSFLTASVVGVWSGVRGGWGQGLESFCVAWLICFVPFQYHFLERKTSMLSQQVKGLETKLEKVLLRAEGWERPGEATDED